MRLERAELHLHSALAIASSARPSQHPARKAMTLTILYFAKARDLAGTSEERLELEAATLRDVLARLIELHPSLRGATDKMRVARNESFAELDEQPNDGDVIALIPPVAGG
jgi:molybdopterin synthase sulfur carrier subunit